MESFDSVSVKKAANLYFDGKVTLSKYQETAGFKSRSPLSPTTAAPTSKRDGD